MTSEIFKWLPKADKDVHGSEVIKGIYVACHEPIDYRSTPQDTSTTLKTNHWIICLVTTEDHSIRVSPEPDYYKQNILHIVVNYDERPVTPTEAKKVWLEFKRQPTRDVDEIFREIMKAKLDKYQFTERGTGCRYWIYCVLELLQQLGCIISDQQCNECKDAIHFVWRDGEKVESEMQTTLEGDKGKFYALV